MRLTSTFLQWHWDRITSVAHSMLASVIPVPRLDSIIDFGCGDGRQLEAIGSAVAARTLAGFDLNEMRLKSARTRGIHALVGNLSHSAPIRDAQFDLAYEYGVTEFLPDFRGLVASMLRVVRPGGLVLFQYGLLRSMGDIHAKEMRAAGFDQYYAVNDPSDLARVLEGVVPRFSILVQKPIWHIYITPRWHSRRIPAGALLWSVANISARVIGMRPVGMYALLRRDDPSP